jgi:hypothetical protein
MKGLGDVTEGDSHRAVFPEQSNASRRDAPTVDRLPAEALPAVESRAPVGVE